MLFRSGHEWGTKTKTCKFNGQNERNLQLGGGHVPQVPSQPTGLSTNTFPGLRLSNTVSTTTTVTWLKFITPPSMITFRASSFPIRMKQCGSEQVKFINKVCLLGRAMELKSPTIFLLLPIQTNGSIGKLVFWSIRWIQLTIQTEQYMMLLVRIYVCSFVNGKSNFSTG